MDESYGGDALATLEHVRRERDSLARRCAIRFESEQQLRAELDAARARIAELEAELAKVKEHRAELSERCYRKDLELDELRPRGGDR